MTTGEPEPSAAPAQAPPERPALPGLEVLLAPVPALLGIGVCGSVGWALEIGRAHV